MRTLWNCTNYNNDLKLTSADAAACNHSGQCDDDVKAVMLKPYVKKQLDTLNPAQLAKELKDYGAWDDTELANHADNLMRWVWISAGDIDEKR